MRRSLHLATLALLVLLTACGRDDVPSLSDTGGLAVTVKALSLAGIGDAEYTVRVYAGDPDAGGALVAEATGLTSSRYGDGAGAVSTVLPCDASAGEHFVRVWLDGLSDTGGAPVDPATWMNPTPVTKRAACVANGDTPVSFNLTVARQAAQGFFDVAVTITNVMCGAKFDCLNEDGEPLKLLHDPVTGVRGTTLVMAFACTSGQATTWLHMTDVHIRCDDGATVTDHWLTPDGEPGNQGPHAPLFFQRGLYSGDEQLANVDKCYWNLAFGLSDTAPANCVLVADASASGESWLAADGRSPQDTVFPYVHYEIPITDAEGALTCGRHALNAADGRVSTAYTDFVGDVFAFECQCGVAPIAEAPRLACGADVVGLGPATAIFSESPSGISAQIGDGSVRSGRYELPEGLRLGGCCLDPCCAQ
ncbi:MAG: hypothetical protein EP329_21700 [Deltaproteobacteria bacterium]|nr:MAG: hypothetical protein EP329_21700 [Deltaproteobacteria bacterium]